MNRRPQRRPTALLRLTLLLLAPLVLAACTQPISPTEQGSLTLTLAAATLSALPGDEVTVQLSVTRGGDFDGEVAVSTADLPAGVAPPNPVTIAAGSSAASLTVALPETLSAGDATLTIVAQGNGVLDTATLTIQVGELSGRIDDSFGLGGAFHFERNSAQFYDLTIDGSGRIVAVGSWYSGVDVPLIVRLTADGVLDTSFATNGVLEVDLGPGESARLRAVAIDGSGRIVAAGDRNNPADCIVVRVSATGALDSGFDTDGIVEIDSGGSDDCNAVIVDGSGRVVTAGDANNDGLIARLNDDGSADASFDADGIATYDPVGGTDEFYAIAQDAAGDLLTAGRVRETDQLDDFALARVNPDGSLDAAFGSGGFVATDFATSNDNARAMEVDNGRIVVAGYSGFGPGGNEDVALARYNADGSLDSGFGQGGTVGIDLFGLYDTALDMAIDATGSYVVAGYGYRNGYAERLMIVAVVDESGVLDTSFNRDGKAVVDAISQGAANAVAIDGNGDVLLAGYDSDGAVVVRLTR